MTDKQQAIDEGWKLVHWALSNPVEGVFVVVGIISLDSIRVEHLLT